MISHRHGRQSEPVLNGPDARDAVTVWLGVCVLMVCVMVSLGGITRLTHSGLSMVQWHPLSVLPPLSAADWQDAFSLYQQSPEYKLVNAGMDLSGFKDIFWLEYTHRLWGRLTGAVFALPLLAFLAASRISRPLAKRLVLVLALGALQGLVGWLMVASGLVDRPQVSHYRLALHLITALLILSALVWTVLDRLKAGSHRILPRALAPALLVGMTVFWGALVAGLHAGLVYDTFPLMNGSVFPDDGLPLTPWALNLVETAGWVQFTHRFLALSTVAALLCLWSWTRRHTPERSGPAATAALWSLVQATLGISTLLSHVPVWLAACHQAGAVILLILVLRDAHGRCLYSGQG